jgi:hypothetical protein
MAFTGNYMCTSFKKELLEGLHDFNASGGNVYKLALFDNTATLDATTTAYSAGMGGEITGTGYTTGGSALTNVDPTSSGTTGFCDFDDLTFSTATITARGALIYNSTNGDRAVVVLDFGSDKTSTAGDFTIVFPTADASNAIIRIA